jgi:hypothetical protein
MTGLRRGRCKNEMSASVKIEIEISGEALAAIPRIRNQAGLARALAREMDQQNISLVSHIQNTYLAFPRSGPTTPEGLRHISGSYFRSLRAARPVIIGGGLESAIGTNVKSRGGVSYPAVHEFGGTIHRKTIGGIMRFKATPSGRLKHQVGNPRLLVFAGKQTKHFVNKAVGGAEWDIHMPARSPIQRGIADRTPDYSTALSGACMKFWKGEIA